MMYAIVELRLDADAVEIKPGRWRAVLMCPLPSFVLPVWNSSSVYLTRETAIEGAEVKLRQLTHKEWPEEGK